MNGIDLPLRRGKNISVWSQENSKPSREICIGFYGLENNPLWLNQHSGVQGDPSNPCICSLFSGLCLCIWGSVLGVTIPFFLKGAHVCPVECLYCSIYCLWNSWRLTAFLHFVLSLSLSVHAVVFFSDIIVSRTLGSRQCMWRASMPLHNRFLL